MPMLSGTRVYLDPRMLEPGPDRIEIRTWRERLFTLPFCPLVATRVVKTVAPAKRVQQLPSGELVMHPAIFFELQKQMKAKP